MATCVKCGIGSVEPRYSYERVLDYPNMKMNYVELLIYKCRCGYCWSTPTKDAERADAASTRTEEPK